MSACVQKVIEVFNKFQSRMQQLYGNMHIAVQLHYPPTSEAALDHSWFWSVIQNNVVVILKPFAVKSHRKVFSKYL